MPEGQIAWPRPFVDALGDNDLGGAFDQFLGATDSERGIVGTAHPDRNHSDGGQHMGIAR